MRRLLIVVVLFSAILFAGGVLASRPAQVTYAGCVQDGVLISEKVDFGTHATEGRNRHIRPLAGDRKPLDLSAYEGSRITVAGHLLPGDTFFAGPDTIRNLGPCTPAGPNARATAHPLEILPCRILQKQLDSIFPRGSQMNTM